MCLVINCRAFQKFLFSPRMQLCAFSKWSSPPIFNPNKILILTKLSRYEFEKQMNTKLSESELEETLTARGSDYRMLLHRHNRHKTVEKNVAQAFEDVGIDTRVVNRFDYTDANIQWADAIVTAGGDGTYLLAASRIQDCMKPVIGFNSDPSRSKGQLCLPEKYSFNASEAVQKLLKGLFRWQLRSRIRVTLIGNDVYGPPVELHDQQLMSPENRYLDFDQQLRNKVPPSFMPHAEDSRGLDVRVLPVLALNEVFIGECISARVSYLEIKFDDDNPVKQKCSGLIISTGTGSTSWTYNVNKLTEQSLEQVLNVVQEATGVSIGASDQRLVSRLTEKFNKLLLTDPEDNRLVYTIRDQLVPPVLPASRVAVSSEDQLLAAAASGSSGDTAYSLNPDSDDDDPDLAVANTFMTPNQAKPRGFARRIYTRSRCFDASLVIDGGISFAFNDGTRTLLEMHPEDALRNVVLHESDSIVAFKH